MQKIEVVNIGPDPANAWHPLSTSVNEATSGRLSGLMIVHLF